MRLDRGYIGSNANLLLHCIAADRPIAHNFRLAYVIHLQNYRYKSRRHLFKAMRSACVNCLAKPFPTRRDCYSQSDGEYFCILCVPEWFVVDVDFHSGAIFVICFWWSLHNRKSNKSYAVKYLFHDILYNNRSIDWWFDWNPYYLFSTLRSNHKRLEMMVNRVGNLIKFDLF